jgi:DNA-binding response OmpR family regulator
MADTLDLWILEDDIALCSLIAEQCQRQHWQLEAFHHPRSLDAALTERSPDLLLLDQMLPEKSGTDVLASLRNRNHQFPVLMISAMAAPSDRVLGLESGADDYISKPFLFRELQLRIQNLIDKQLHNTPLSPPPATVLRFANLRFKPGLQLLEANRGDEIRLSRGESSLLLALCQQPEVVISRQSLAQMTGSLVDPERSRTFDVRISRLRRILRELTGADDLIRPIRGEGYRLEATVLEETA